MLTMQMQHPPMTEVATFHCDNLQRTIPVAACLDWYVDHNALARRDSPCFKCRQGHRVRDEFSRS